jgi:hypothetical protein
MTKTLVIEIKQGRDCPYNIEGYCTHLSLPENLTLSCGEESTTIIQNCPLSDKGNTVQISLDLAENLLDNTNELLSEIIPMRNYARYDTRCKLYESEIAQLQAAIEIDKRKPI